MRQRRPRPGSSKLFGTRAKMFKCYLQSGHILQARKTPYTALHNVYIHEHLFYFVDIYICVAGKHIVGPTIKVQHRNMLEKRSQHTYYSVSANDSNVLLLRHVPRWLEGLPNSA